MSSFARQWVRLFFALFALTLVTICARTASAFPGPIDTDGTVGAGYITSAWTAGGGCPGCHGAPTWTVGQVSPVLSMTSSNGTARTRTLTSSGVGASWSAGAYQVEPGVTATFQIEFNTQVHGTGTGGFLIWHADGTSDSSGLLIPVGTEHSCNATVPDAQCGPGISPPEVAGNNTEIMHSHPVASDGNGNIFFTFQYKAPTTVGICNNTFTFNIWVNSEDGNAQCEPPDSGYGSTFTIKVGCDDGLACNGTETCSSNTCVAGTAVNCNDNNVCTTDSCLNFLGSAFCQNVNNTLSCDDNNVCTTGTTCSGGSCGGGSTVPTDDGNPCTADSCDSVTGVHHTPITGGACDDGNACTQSTTCNAGACNGGSAVPTDDGNPCTIDSCNTVSGVQHTPITGGACDDGNPCTTGTTCSAGVCNGGSATIIDDNNICTTDSCDAVTGIHHVAAPSGTVCHNALMDGPCDAQRTCGGATSCPVASVFLTASTACGPGPSCSDATSQELLQSHCDGAHLTCPAQTPQPCNGEACAGNICGGGCAGDDTKCIAGDFCNVNACQPKVGSGQPCITNSYCTTGLFCADGVCCNSACGNSDPTDCQACNLTGSVGTCTVPVGQVCRAAQDICDQVEKCVAGNTACPADQLFGTSTVCRASTDGNLCDIGETCTGNSVSCPADDLSRNGTTCTNDNNPCTQDLCNNDKCTHTTPAVANTSCRPVVPGEACDKAEVCDGVNLTCPPDGFLPSTQNCTSAACSNNVATLPANCPGSNGNCPTVQTKKCTPFTCNGTTCGTTCNVKTDCATGNFCNSSHLCVAELPPGQLCTAGEQCQSPGLCVDGVCCNQACTGQCQACDVVGKAGTCSPITDKVPHGSRTKCVGDGSACQGFCDGVDTANCSQPGATTQCLAPTCTNGVAIPVEVCNNTGNCPTQAPVTCAPGICQAATGPNAICVGGSGAPPCMADEECAAGNYCAAGVCKPQGGNGATCGADDQCTNGHCVDGLCCNEACDGQCQACDLPSAKGTCTTVPAGEKPHGARTQCVSDPAFPTCAGQCDGKSALACSFPGSGTTCRAASCAKDVAVLPAFCTGTGTCSPEQDQACPQGVDCNSAGTLCDGGCTADRDCPMNQYCSGGVCVPTLTTGKACSTSSQCVGSCVDGFCCNTSCDGQCEACNIKGKEGVCTPVTGAPIGLREACTTDGTAACAGSCNGTNRTACAFPGNTKQCSPPSCANDVATLAEFCDGNGSCPTAEHQVCGSFNCSGTTKCNGDCATSGTCPAGNFCSAGVCVPQVSNTPPHTCGSNAECQSGNCVDGFCCDGACTGQCQACDVPGSEGTCVVIANDLPHGGRAACPGAGACASVCDGTSPTACNFPSMTVTCGKSSCAVNGDQIGAPTCNGAGVCLPGAAANCGSYTCDPPSGLCLTDCVLGTDCAPGFDCENSKCTKTQPDAGIADSGTDASTPPDASVMTDASTDGMAPDATTDAGIADSGTDAATNTDAGLVPPGHSTDKGSCGCSVPGAHGSSSNLLFIAGLGLVAAAARRRRRAASAAARY